jgi:hypothetical protein
VEDGGWKRVDEVVGGDAVGCNFLEPGWAWFGVDAGGGERKFVVSGLFLVLIGFWSVLDGTVGGSDTLLLADAAIETVSFCDCGVDCDEGG